MTFKIDLTSEDIELIGRLLDEQPFKIVAPLARRMQAQIDAQLAAPDVIELVTATAVVSKKRKGR